MYCVTFYSFKGGVGRTMALVNIGYQLATAGKAVLFVDFDLEAPGLGAYLDVDEPDKKGVVDFVSEYQETGQAPRLADYVSQCYINGDADRRAAWLMSAGSRDGTYVSKLANIDWKRLYKEQRGYLLIEHLRNEWQKHIRPDYVLIDSRTGYTDESGICTRQLADALVVMFFPNSQNIQGSAAVVNAVRKENQHLSSEGLSPSDLPIHFVAANVPDLDDEDGILYDSLRSARESLVAGTIKLVHHYPHLDLVSQRVFSATHPRSRLAREYQDLTNSIRGENVEDVEGATAFLERMTNLKMSPGEKLESSATHVKKIVYHHAGNRNILQRAAAFYKSVEQFESCARTLSMAIELDPDIAQNYLDRAVANKLLANFDEARSDIIDAAKCSDANYIVYASAIESLRHDLDVLTKLIEKGSKEKRFLEFSSSERHSLATALMSESPLVSTALELYESLIEDPQYASHGRTGKVLSLIHLGRFADAISYLGDRSSLNSIPDIFNYAFAAWANENAIEQTLFETVVTWAEERKAQKADLDVNGLQCVAFANWALGQRGAALQTMGDCIALLRRIPTRNFSVWRYLYVDQRTFVTDCDQLLQFIDRGVGVPHLPNVRGEPRLVGSS